MGKNQLLYVALLALVSLVVFLPYLSFVSHFHLQQQPPAAPASSKLEATLGNTLDPSSADLLRVIAEARAVVDRTSREFDLRPADARSRSLAQAAPSLRALAVEHKIPSGAIIESQYHPLPSPPTSLQPVQTQALPALRLAPSAPSVGATRSALEDYQDLVVGLGTGITPENLAVFAGSFREVNAKAALVLYLDAPLPDTHRTIVERYNITAIEFHVQLLEPVFLRKYHPSNYRWPLLYRYIEEHSGRYRKVLMADVRDTAFQQDPFGAFSRKGFYTFNGVESRTIGECGWNGGWVKDCFGKEMLSRIAKKTIICSGISMGTVGEVESYLKLMTDTMETEAFAKCERNGVDQGVHNVLVHTQRIAGLVVHDQKSGWVANLQAGLARVSNNVVSNQRGQKVAVVHQYDRLKELQESYFKKYVFWPMPAEAETCAAFHVVKDAELFKKKCDLRVVSGHSASHCCVSCLRNDKCKAFSFAGSQCFLKSCSTSTQRISARGVHSGYLKAG
jgi:hypothetical protein